MPISFPAIPWGGMTPLLVVAGTGLLVLLLDPFIAPERRGRLAIVTLLGFAVAVV